MGWGPAALFCIIRGDILPLNILIFEIRFSSPAPLQKRPRFHYYRGMTSTQILQPLLAGLSVGAFCLTSCVPFMGSFLAAEERSLKKNTGEVLKFLAGRLLGYLGFGLLAGYLGERFDSRWLRLATALSFILLSVILLFYLLGLLRREKRTCPSSGFFNAKSPVLMGFFMGINLCPPFLLSVTFIFSQHSTFYGLAYFLLFFLSSSLFFLPLIFVGLLAQAAEFRAIARLSGFLVSGIFFVYGIYSIFHTL